MRQSLIIIACPGNILYAIITNSAVKSTTIFNTSVLKSKGRRIYKYLSGFI